MSTRHRVSRTTGRGKPDSTCLEGFKGKSSEGQWGDSREMISELTRDNEVDVPGANRERDPMGAKGKGQGIGKSLQNTMVPQGQ
jgi:hypothetical protein